MNRFLALGNDLYPNLYKLHCLDQLQDHRICYSLKDNIHYVQLHKRGHFPNVKVLIDFC